MRRVSAVIAVLLGGLVNAHAQTPTVPFSQFIQSLPAVVGTVNPTDFLYINQGGVSKKAAVSQLSVSLTTLPVPNGGTGQTNFTLNLPVVGNGIAALQQGTVSGNTTKFVTANGVFSNGHCAGFDASGNLVDEGGPCTTGGGGGTVTAGTTGQIAYYTAATTTISGSTLTIGQGGTVAVAAQVPVLPLQPQDIAASSSSNTQCLTSGGMQTPGWTTCQFGGQRNFLRNSSLVDSCQLNLTFPSIGTNVTCTNTITTAGGWCVQGIYVIPVGDSVDCIWSAPGKGNGLFGASLQLNGHTNLTDVKLRFIQDSWEGSQMSGQSVSGPFHANALTFQMVIHNNSSGVMYPTISTAVASGAGGPDDFSTVTTDLAAQPMQICQIFAIFDVECLESFTWTPNYNIQNGYEETIDLHPTDNLAGGAWINPGFDLRLTPGMPTGVSYNPPSPSFDPALDRLRDQRFYQQIGTYNNAVSTEMPLCLATGTNSVVTTYQYPTMRATPTISFSGLNALNSNGGFSTSLTATNASFSATAIIGSLFAATTFTSGTMYRCQMNGTMFIDASLIGG